MTTSCESKEALDVSSFIECLTIAQRDYWTNVKQAFERNGNILTDEIFIPSPGLAHLYALAFQTARGAEIYEIIECLNGTAAWFDKVLRSPEIKRFFIESIGETPEMTGEKFQQSLKEEIDFIMTTRNACRQVHDFLRQLFKECESPNAGRDVDIVPEGVLKKIGLRYLRYAVITPSDSRHDRINRELLEDATEGSSAQGGLSRQIVIRAWSAENALDALNCSIDGSHDEEGIDVILLDTSLPYKRGGDREGSVEEVQRFLEEFEALAAKPEAAIHFKDTKIVVVNESLDPVLLWQLRDKSERVLGGIDMPPNAISLPIALAALLTEKGIIVLDLKHIDAQLLVHADNFRRETQNLFKERDVDRRDIWKNEPFLREMHALINQYRSAEGLEEVEFQTQGMYLYVIIMGEIYKGEPVPASLLFAEDPRGVRQL